MRILVLNGGSSSIKFSVFVLPHKADTIRISDAEALLDGELSGVGAAATLKIARRGSDATKTDVNAKDVAAAVEIVMNAIASDAAGVAAVGYRVVHPGARLLGHQRITQAVLDQIKSAEAFAPLHNPEALQLIHSTMQRMPRAAHFACFDTVFHQTMPVEATTYPLPAALRAAGVRRYGFHGLSCESVVVQLREHGKVPGRLVIAHLGSGCSVTAVSDGESVDTTMGLTPTGGVLMGTRSGDLDPGLMLYLLRQQPGSRDDAAAAIETMLNRDSGIASLSCMANDVKAVRAAAAEGNADAALALRIFTRSVAKAIAGFLTVLGGLDALVFTGGIGEHDSHTRADVAGALAAFGIRLQDAPVGAVNSIQRISPADAKIAVFIVPAQEDPMIALHVARMMAGAQRDGNND